MLHYAVGQKYEVGRTGGRATAELLGTPRTWHSGHPPRLCVSLPQAHFDYFHDTLNTQNGGQRVATVLLYLCAAAAQRHVALLGALV